MSSQAAPSTPESTLYRRVWRWHFYAGLVCLPFLALMALTGALYLFKDPIESLVRAGVRFVEVKPARPLDAESLVAKARAAQPGEAVRFVPPREPGRSAEVGIRTATGTVSVYLDPASGRVLGALRDDRKLMELVKRIHSLAIAGTVANHGIEVVAGWAIVLVVSGLFLWWPRGRSGGVCNVRGRPASRTWWRDLHAVTGAVASTSIGLNAALGIFTRLGMPAGTPIGLPAGPRGVYTAMLFPDDVRAERVVHLDRYSGAVLADVGYRDYGVAGRLTEWGVSLHTGRQFGWVNQLVMLAGCLAIVLLAVSAAVMWWKRRPRGRLAAPPRRSGDRAAFGAIAVAVLLGLLYPLLGASMLVALLVDAVVPQRWHARFGL
jgi:uncharacterized iron-regulated membrane protein